MTDRELLELAAKAVGIRITEWGEPDYYSHREGEVAYSGGMEWNPLTDNGDALELAVDLGLDIAMHEEKAGAFLLRGGVEAYEPHNDDPYAATRRAIVRAAAEIGERRE